MLLNPNVISQSSSYLAWLVYHLKKVKVTQSVSNFLRSHGLSMEFSRPEYWVGSLYLLQGIFPAQGSNPGLPHCGQILYQLSHKGSPRTLEWVAYPFSRGSSRPRNRTRVSRTTGRFFANWAIREARLFLFKRISLNVFSIFSFHKSTCVYFSPF